MPELDLLVVGELNADLVLRGDVRPAFGQAEQLLEAADLVLGSSGAITACGAARLGARVGIAGLVGDDRFGDVVLEGLRAAGVDTRHVAVRPGGATGLTVVLAAAGGERAMLTHPGLVAALRAEDVPAAALASARHVHVSSPFLQPALRPGLAGLLRAARRAGATTSLDPGWDPAGRWDLDDVLDHVDILLPNGAELRNLARERDVGRAAAVLAARGPLVAAKLGASGALLHDGVRPLRVGAPAVEVVDSTGAGDAFDAGLLVARLDGAPPREALALGVAAGALSLRAPGGTAGQPDRAEAAALAAALGDAPPAEGSPAPTATARELASQPRTWRAAAALPAAELAKLPGPRARVLALGSGTSFHVLDAWARRRQELLGAPTRALIASEVDAADAAGPVDAVVVLSRSGTSTDPLGALERLGGRAPVVALCGTPGSPIADAADAVVDLAFADEESVVQTRFATTALALLRHALGEDLAGAVAQAEEVLAEDPEVAPDAFGHVVFLGTGWSLGLAHEAALKCREAAQMRTEAYAVGEYAHGPIALAGAGTLVWSLAPLPAALAAALAPTGATVREAGRDPMAELVAVHRLAEATARARGLDPDRPAHLNRSVVVPA